MKLDFLPSRLGISDLQQILESPICFRRLWTPTISQTSQVLFGSSCGFGANYCPCRKHVCCLVMERSYWQRVGTPLPFGIILTVLRVPHSHCQFFPLALWGTCSDFGWCNEDFWCYFFCKQVDRYWFVFARLTCCSLVSKLQNTFLTAQNYQDNQLGYYSAYGCFLISEMISIHFACREICDIAEELSPAVPNETWLLPAMRPDVCEWKQEPDNLCESAQCQRDIRLLHSLQWVWRGFSNRMPIDLEPQHHGKLQSRSRVWKQCPSVQESSGWGLSWQDLPIHVSSDMVGSYHIWFVNSFEDVW